MIVAEKIFTMKNRDSPDDETEISLELIG